ncbi:hypothetical protein [Neorhizobium galegae]|uniref:hypothetical protein n=1 Tax=Neorhizobium galegae TaxID=399 RepID=UPI001AE6D80B
MTGVQRSYLKTLPTKHISSKPMLYASPRRKHPREIAKLKPSLLLGSPPPCIYQFVGAGDRDLNLFGVRTRAVRNRTLRPNGTGTML